MVLFECARSVGQRSNTQIYIQLGQVTFKYQSSVLPDIVWFSQYSIALRIQWRLIFAIVLIFAICSKMCLLNCTVLLEKQHFRIFQHSNICNETRGVNKNHFLSSTLCISFKVSKFQNRPRPLFKTGTAQMHYSPWKSTFSNFSASIIRNESRWVNKNRFLSYTLPIALKIREFKNWTHPLFKTVSAEMYCFI